MARRTKIRQLEQARLALLASVGSVCMIEVMAVLVRSSLPSRVVLEALSKCLNFRMSLVL